MIWILCMCGVLVEQPTPAQKELLKTFRDEFVQITPGEGKFPAAFTQGRDDGTRPNEKPARQVTLKHSFWIAKYEVPQNLWEAVMGSNPSRWKGPRNSVEMLSFSEAEQFCRKATEMMRAAGLIEKDQVIRLPSESEWEYVARAGTTTHYSFGNDPMKLTDFGWYTGNAAGNDPPVGAKRPNDWGLYDIHGYLWEWTSDPGNPSYQGAPTDGTVWATGDKATRVLRGGSWTDAAEQLTSSYRQMAPVDTRGPNVGLRCVLAKE